MIVNRHGHAQLPGLSRWDYVYIVSESGIFWPRR